MESSEVIVEIIYSSRLFGNASVYPEKLVPFPSPCKISSNFPDCKLFSPIISLLLIECDFNVPKS